MYIINNDIKINLSHVIISSLDVPGFVVANNEGLTVALDININDELKGEGLAREFVNRIQNLRKEKKLDVTDNIRVFVSKNKTLSLSIQNNLAYICEETLASELNYDSDLIKNPHEIQLVDNISVKVSIEKNLNMNEKTTYSAKELEEFKEIILKKINSAQEDLAILRAATANDSDNGTEDTSPSFKAFEEGSTTLSKEENVKLAERQAKFIRSLKNALIRIENNTYGICRVTGKLIAKERLKLVPHATLSIEAKNAQ